MAANEAPGGSVGILRRVASEHGVDMVARFYDTLLQDDEAQRFLNHSVVHTRLSTSLLEWLKALFDEADIRDCPRIQERQHVIGQVHARINIPIHLVMQGAAALKARFAQVLPGLAEPHSGLAALQLGHERIDVAIMMMSQAYVKDTTARARLDEAYRLFSIDQDVSTEKEAQKASLMEWSQKTLFSLLQGKADNGLTRLSDSPFGLWLRHRASFMFERSIIYQDLLAETHRIDRLLLPQLEEPGGSNQRTETLSDLQAAVTRVSSLVMELFQSLTAMESGRDPLTRTLNRRFLPAILGREIEFANANSSGLCIILLDVDHFKQINDRHGHQTGDLALRQVAQVVMDHVRPSDFVFRYGGEEFLIVLNETRAAQAHVIAERIRGALEQTRIDAGGEDALAITASMGVAEHHGHPDQARLIKDADAALYRAKGNGRNRIEIAAAAG
ncbi:GGDEF domain-containing protein [Sphingomonas sp.]|jgi:diguanylate cyclase|uniref:GGDEF domain-containing protein n=1 Tax=Sphingomonas sp. TaxID=28214 RepID=UPI00262C500B|nr:GGDEF domain-containing protein [Sphingomonas sp.]MDF2493824.1 diguanylate cyclase [Sphingomonas sp.]